MRVWVSSVYLPPGPHQCPLCHETMTRRSDEAEAGESLPSFWDVRLHSHDQIGHQPPRTAEVRVVFEALELLLDGLAGTDMGGDEELARRAAWADFVLRRAFDAITAGSPLPPEQRGPGETLNRGGRVWTALDQSQSGREAALSIAGLPPDDLRASLLAAALERIRARSPEDAEKWVEALSNFTEWWRPQDLL